MKICFLDSVTQGLNFPSPQWIWSNIQWIWSNIQWIWSNICLVDQMQITLDTLPETNGWHLEITPWKRRFLLETIIFRGCVSFREGSQKKHNDWIIEQKSAGWILLIPLDKNMMMEVVRHRQLHICIPQAIRCTLWKCTQDTGNDGTFHVFSFSNMAMFDIPVQFKGSRPCLGGGNSNIFWNFHPENWGR